MRNGQITMTLPGPAGDPAVFVSWFFDPDTLVLRDNPTSWTDPTGTVWDPGTGALIGVNNLDRDARMVIYGDGGATVRQVLLPATATFSATAEQLKNTPPPDGPYLLATDLNGLSFDLSEMG